MNKPFALIFLFIELTFVHFLPAQNSFNTNLIGSWALPGSPYRDIALHGHIGFIIGNDSLGLRIMDFSDPANPVQLGSNQITGVLYEVAVSGDFVYVLTKFPGGGVAIVDATSLADPVQLSWIPVGGYIWNFTQKGNYVYVATGVPGLRIIDVSNPASPVAVGAWITGTDVYDVDVQGNYAYVISNGYGLQILDISNPANPVLTGSYLSGGPNSFEGVRVSGNYAYLVIRNDGLYVVDISNSASPVLAAATRLYMDVIDDMALQDGYLYLAGFITRVFNVSNPLNPYEAGYIDPGGRAQGIAIDNHLMFLTAADALSIVEFHPLNSLIELQSPNGGDIWEVFTNNVIRWRSINVSTLKIELSTDNGSNWSLITPGWGGGASSFNYYVPNTPSEECLVKLTNLFDPNTYDLSDGNFTIYNPNFKVLQPNGGETLIIGQNYDIQWLSVGSDNLDIYYSPNNGVNWNLIAASYPAPAGSYSWVAPGPVSQQNLIKIVDSQNPLARDVSDAPFKMDSLYQNYFPLEVGNTWYFTRTCTLCPTTYSAMVVVKDTLMSDGQVWAQIDCFDRDASGNWIQNPQHTRYYRQEATEVFQYPDTKILDFSWSADSIFQWKTPVWLGQVQWPASSYVVTSASTGITFGRPVRVFSIRWSLYIYFALADYFGFYTLYCNSTPYTGGEYIYLIGCVINGIPYGNILTDIKPDITAIPEAVLLWQNYPNPFNPTTTIRYTLPGAAPVTLKIYTITGQEVRTLVNQRQQPGEYSMVWDGRNNNGQPVSSGVYIYRLWAGDGYVQSRKMVLLR